MDTGFTQEEKTTFLLKKHIKDNFFNYLIDMIVNLVFVIILLYLCEAQRFAFGILLSIAYSIGCIVSSIVAYKKTITKNAQ